MFKKPFISIITASFNNESTIRETIESIKNQTFNNIEHIIIDNCSTDSTLNIIKEYAGTYNLTWLSEPDNGIADALNKGLERAKGKYFLVIQADDRLITPEILQNIYPEIINEKYDIVSYPIILDDPKNGKILFSNKPLWKIYFRTVIRHQGALIHRRLHEKIGNYDSSYSVAMDYDFFYRAFTKKSKIGLKNIPIAEMGASGVASSIASFSTRNEENYRAQRSNENNILWILIQFFYFYYKKYLRHRIRKSFKNFDC